MKIGGIIRNTEIEKGGKKSQSMLENAKALGNVLIRYEWIKLNTACQFTRDVCQMIPPNDVQSSSITS